MASESPSSKENSGTDDPLVIDDTLVDINGKEPFPEVSSEDGLDWVRRVYGNAIRSKVERLMQLPEHAEKSIYKLARIEVGDYWREHQDEIGTLLDVTIGGYPGDGE